MSRHFLKKLGLSAALLLSVYACGGGGVPDDATGREIYVQVCARCHGDDLTGQVGPALVGEGAKSVDRPESYLVQSISAGIGSMPAMRGTLTEEQIRRAARYVMERQGR